jgi:hypothetical protein
MSKAAIEAIVHEYFHGMYEGDAERLKAIFHEDCRLFGEHKGEKSESHVSDFLAYVASAPVPKNEGEPYDMELLSIDLTGPVAVAHVKDLYQGGRFTDYLTCMETDQGWKIVNKAFYSRD